MGAKTRKTRSKELNSIQTKDTKEEERKSSFFSGLFSPGSAESSVSSSQDEDSVGSSTNLSTVSSASDETDSRTANTESIGGNQEKFDRDRRAKHRAACKNMTVSVFKLWEPSQSTIEEQCFSPTVERMESTGKR